MRNMLDKTNQKLKNIERKNNKGFTLVELIIVIAIIAVLAAVLAPQYIKYVDKSRWAADKNSTATLLSEVQTTIVELSEDETKTVNGGTITVTKSGVTQEPATDTAFTNAMTATDPNWNKITVTNKGKAAVEEKADQKHATYTITYTATGAKGEWTA